MLGSIWQFACNCIAKRRTGLDRADIRHVRADLRFRLAILEYAYYGRSGKRVMRCLEELKGLLGDKALHRYLRTLDPDLRIQFVERFQGKRREAGHDGGLGESTPQEVTQPAVTFQQTADQPVLGANVVPISQAARKPDAPEEAEPPPAKTTRSNQESP